MWLYGSGTSDAYKVQKMRNEVGKCNCVLERDGVEDSARTKKRELTGAGNSMTFRGPRGSSALRCLFDIPEQVFAVLYTLLNPEPLEDLERVQGLRC